MIIHSLPVYKLTAELLWLKEWFIEFDVFNLLSDEHGLSRKSEGWSNENETDR